MRNAIARIALVAALLSGIAGTASAATATGNFNVTMTIQSTCSVQPISDLAFGTQTAVTSNLDATTSIGVQCTNATPYTIALSAGSGSGATVAARLMTTSSGATAGYSIYRDSSRSQVWGATTSVDTQGGTGNGSVQSYTAYGRVPPISNPTAGAYTDAVAVTVTY